MPEAESVLVARCRAGDPAAWDVVFDQQYDPVARFLFQLSPELSPEDVEDVCQEVFLSAVRNLASFRGKSALQTWLFRIAVNKGRDYLEKRHAAKRGGGQAPRSLDEPHPDTGLKLDLPSPAAGPDEAAAAAEEAARLRAALDVLGDPCRELIELRYFGELSYEEIARALGITVKAVGSRLHHCLEALAGRLDPRAPRGATPPKPV
jgi:RNA polymerase sigma-70 factor (ECF subfamily)